MKGIKREEWCLTIDPIEVRFGQPNSNNNWSNQ